MKEYTLDFAVAGCNSSIAKRFCAVVEADNSVGLHAYQWQHTRAIVYVTYPNHWTIEMITSVIYRVLIADGLAYEAGGYVFWE